MTSPYFVDCLKVFHLIPMPYPGIAHIADSASAFFLWVIYCIAAGSPRFGYGSVLARHNMFFLFALLCCPPRRRTSAAQGRATLMAARHHLRLHSRCIFRLRPSLILVCYFCGSSALGPDTLGSSSATDAQDD